MDIFEIIQTKSGNGLNNSTKIIYNHILIELQQLVAATRPPMYWVMYVDVTISNYIPKNLLHLYTIRSY